MGYLDDLYEGDRDILYPAAREAAEAPIREARLAGLWVVAVVGPYYGRQTDAYIGEIRHFERAYGSERLAMTLAAKLNAGDREEEEYVVLGPVWPKRAEPANWRTPYQTIQTPEGETIRMQINLAAILPPPEPPVLDDWNEADALAEVHGEMDAIERSNQPGWDISSSDDCPF